MIRDGVDEIRRAQLRQERRDNIRQKNNAFWYTRSNKIESSAQDDNVKDIIDETKEPESNADARVSAVENVFEALAEICPS